MNLWKAGGYAAIATGVAAGVGVGGALVEAPMVHGAASQQNGDFFAAGFGTVMGVMLGSAGAIAAAVHGQDALAMAGVGVAVGSIAARIGASHLDG
jgi:hypothetical protein